MQKILSLFNLHNTPLFPLLFGIAGAIPFIFLSFGIWFFTYEVKLIALYNLINYSVLILSFTGAIHWGAAMVRNDKGYKSYLTAILPALLSWFLLIGFIVNYLINRAWVTSGMLNLSFQNIHTANALPTINSSGTNSQ